MDVDNEIVCYTDRWEQTISSDSCDDESDVGSAGGHGGNFIKHKEHTFSRTAIRSVVGHRRESLFQFHDSEVADNVCETVYVDRLEHILALDAEVLSNTSVIVNNMLSEDTDNIFSYDTSSDISQLLHESRVGAEKWSDGREENIDEHIERGTTKLQHYDFLDLGLGKTLSLHYTERWERTEVKDDFPVSQKIKMSKLFHPWKSLIIESISTALDAGNNIMKGSVKDELTMNKEGISSKTVVPEVNWSSDVQFHDHKIQEARVSCQKLNITEENNSFPNTKAVCDCYVNTNSTLGLQLERREHISVPDVTTVFVEMANIRDNISMNDIDNTQSVEETTHGIHDLSNSGLSGAVTYYIDRWERTEHVQDLTDNHIIVSRGNHPWEASRNPSSIISIHNYDTNKLKGIHDERLHHSVNNQEVIPLTGPPVVTHGNDKSSNTTLMSTRHFQKRKIIEVNKNDFSGVEVRHTSYLNITIGSQSREHLLASELNTALLETMDTDIIISPRENETFCNSEFPVNLPLAMSKEETIDRWNYDTSSNSMACDSHERFVETGDCVFASDSNDSCLEDSLRRMGFTALVKNCSDVPKIILKPGTADTEIAFLNDTDLSYRQLGNLEEIRQKQTSDRQFCGTVNQTACSKIFNDSENIDLHGDRHINIEYGHEGYARKDEKEDDDNLKIENTGQNSTGSCINEDTEYVTETDSESSGIHDNTEHVLKKKVDDTKYVIGNDSKHTKIHSECLVKQREDNTEYFAHNNDGDCRRDHGTQCLIKERSEFTVYVICSTLEDSRRDNKTERVINQKVVDTKHIMMNYNEDSRKDDTGHVVKKEDEDSAYIMKNKTEDFIRHNNTDFVAKQDCEGIECAIENVFEDSNSDCNKDFIVKQKYKETEGVKENNTEDLVITQTVQNVDVDDSSRNNDSEYVVKQRGNDCEEESRKDNDSELVVKQGGEDTEDSRQDDKTISVITETDGNSGYIKENDSEDCTRDGDTNENYRRHGNTELLDKHIIPDIKHILNNNIEDSKRDHETELLIKQRSEDTECFMQSQDSKTDSDIKLMIKQTYEETDCVMRIRSENCQKDDTEHVGKGTKYVIEKCIGDYERDGGNKFVINCRDENTECDMMNDSEDCRNDDTECVVKQGSGDAQYVSENYNEDSRNDDDKELVCKQTSVDIDIVLEKGISNSRRNGDMKHLVKQDVKDTVYVMANDSDNSGKNDRKIVKHQSEDTIYVMANESTDFRMDTDTQNVYKQRIEGTEYIMHNIIDNSRTSSDTHFVTDNKIEDSGRCGNTYFVPEYCVQSDSENSRTGNREIFMNQEGENSEFITEHESEGSSKEYVTRNYNEEFKRNCTDLEYAIVNSSDDSRIIDTSFLSLNKKGNGIEYTMDYNGEDILKDVEYFMANVSEDSTKFDDTEDVFKQDNADDEYMMSNDCEDSTRFDDIEGVFKQDNEDSEYIMANVGKDSARCDDTECVFTQDNEDSEYIMANAGEDSTRCDDLEGVFKQDNEDVEYIMANVGEDATRFDVIEGCCDETEGVVKLENRNAVANVGEDSTKCDGTEIVFKQDNEDAEYMIANVGKGSTRCVDIGGVVRQDNEDAEYIMANVDENFTAYDKTEGVFKLENQDAEYGMANVGEDATRFDVIEGVFKQDNEDAEYVMANVGEDSTKCVDSEGVFKQDNEDADYVMVNVGDDSTRCDDTEYVVKLETENDEYVMENILEDCTKCDDTEIMVIPGGEDTAFVTEDGIEDSKSKSDSKLVIKQRNEHTEYVVGNYLEDSKRDNDAKLVFRQSWLENNFKIVGTGNNDQYNVHNMHNLVNTENIDQLPTDTLSGGKFYHEVDIRNNCVVNKQSSNYIPKSETFNGQVNREIMSSKVPQSANKIDEPEDIPGSQFQDSACAKHKYTPCVVKFDILSVNTDLDMTNKVSSDIIANTRSDLGLRRPSIAGPKVFPEDVVGKQFEAEQIVACSPFTSRRLGVQISTSLSEMSATISEADLLSEYDLLETSSRDQLESLKLVVLEDEKYKAEIDNLLSVNSESRDALNKSVVVDVSIHTQQQQEYKQNRQAKELEKDEVILQRRQLMKISSEIQSSDIELNRVHLEEKCQHLKDILDARSEDTWQFQMTQLNDLERCSDQVDTARTVIESRAPSIPVACESTEVEDMTIFNSEINRYFQSGSPKFCWRKNVNATYQMELRPVKSLTVIQKSCSTSTSRDMNSSSITTRSSDQSSESSFLLGMRSPALSLDTNTSPVSYKIFSAQASRKSTTQRIRDGIDGQVLLRRWENLKRLALQQDFRLYEDKYDHIRFANEIDNILAWLLEAEALQSLHQSLPSDISQLDVIVRQFKDFKCQLESKKVSVLFINLLSEKYLEEKTAESMLLHNKLDKMNSHWQLVLSRAKHTEKNLQVSLIQCQEFHHRMHDYQLWLENIETCIHTCEPVNLNLDDSVRKKYVRLLALSDELQHSQLQLMSLRDTADQVLMSTDSLEVSRARSKVHSLHSHMQTLVGLISSYSSTLEKTLQTSSNRGSTFEYRT